MRTLATIALSFAAGVFAAVLLGVGVWQLWAAGGLPAGGTGAAGAEADDARPAAAAGMLIPFALCGALVYTALFQALVQAPVTARCGQTGEFSGTVLSRPVETGGASVSPSASPARRPRRRSTPMRNTPV